MTIRVLIADDHALVREGMKVLLEPYEDIAVIGSANDGKECVELALQSKPDVILMDLAMAGMNGIEATRRVVDELQDTAVLCVSFHSERQFVEAALGAGASGYALKDCSIEELIEAIRALAGGQYYLSPATGVRLRDVIRDRDLVPRGVTSVGSRLSSREREVLQLISEGVPTKEIAWRLGLSHKTIGTHREHIMQKLDIHTVPGLTKYAIREGLTSMEG